MDFIIMFILEVGSPYSLPTPSLVVVQVNRKDATTPSQLTTSQPTEEEGGRGE
jgi:hypothetical protein